MYRFSFDEEWIPISTPDVVEDLPSSLSTEDGEKLYVGGRSLYRAMI